MEQVYDNGYVILGKVDYVKRYVIKNCDESWEIEDLIKDLDDLEETDIVAINYDLPMGYRIECWAKDSIVEV